MKVLETDVRVIGGGPAGSSALGLKRSIDALRRRAVNIQPVEPGRMTAG